MGRRAIPPKLSEFVEIQRVPLWTLPLSISSELVKIGDALEEVRFLSARRRISRESLTESLTRIECAIYAIKQDLKKED
jgi:hypothetical protein